MIEQQRARVIAVAREWIGTRYQHGARIKGVVCDCTFPAKVYEEAGVCTPIGIAPYTHNAHLHRASGQYRVRVREFAVQVDAPGPGDLALYLIARDFSHSAIVVSWPAIIHADRGAGGVIEAFGDRGELERARAVEFYSPKAWCDR